MKDRYEIQKKENSSKLTRYWKKMKWNKELSKKLDKRESFEERGKDGFRGSGWQEK